MPVSEWGKKPIDIPYLLSRRWWKDVEIGGADECWPWLKSTASHGYGQTWDGVTVRLAHRVAWTLHHGRQIPPGITVDHECRNRRCCNPAHLRLMTNHQNASDNGAVERTHCQRGHKFDDANTYTSPQGIRACRACRAVTQRRWAQMNRRES